jgi:hypothetical protein
MRRRYRYDKGLQRLVEVTQDDRLIPSGGPYVMPDLNAVYREGGIHSPIDGSFITSRAQLRRHNNTHQVRCGGDFKPGDLINKEKRRVEINRQLARQGKVDFAWK